MEPVTIGEPCSSLDIILHLSNLLGLDYDSRLLMGRDITQAILVIFADGSHHRQGALRCQCRNSDNPGVSVEEGYVNPSAILWPARPISPP